jgi:dGTP triphosphohydrolase
MGGFREVRVEGSCVIVAVSRAQKDVGSAIIRRLRGSSAFADFLAGMTDAYAVEIYEQVFVPRRWFVL